MTNPKVIGICGLIGSGKSVVKRALEVMYGLPTFDSDQEAKKLYFLPHVRSMTMDRLGFDPILRSEINKEALSDCLRHPERKAALQQIIHRELETQWAQWRNVQKSEVIVFESAILYTSGFYKHCDTVISVVAPTDVRKERVMKRDGIGRVARFESIERIQQEEKHLQGENADHHIVNAGGKSIIEQIEQIQHSLLSH